jgi:arylsulfatase A-like enzyme
VRESTLDEEDYHDAYIGRLTRDWLAGYEGDEPFFCWCNWGGPHMPWDAPGRYAQMYPLDSIDPPLVDPLTNAPADIRRKQEAVLAGMPPDVWELRQASQPMPDDAWRACRSHYYGMINVVDDGIGAMLDVLEARGLLENTIVIYASDHGEMLLDRNLYGKQLMYEQSARVPLIVRWPECFGQGVKSEALVSSLDLIATLLDVAGAEMPVVHGQSLAPLLEGSTQSHSEALFCEWGPEKMVREGPWKYVYHPEREIQQLFNLHDDPQELENLAGTQEALERRLRERLLDWLISTETKPNSL